MRKTVESYIGKNKHWEEALRKLRQLCQDTSMKEEIKWGAPIYTMDGKNIVGFMGFKSYVGLWFHQGVFLEDEYNLLEQSNEKTKGLRKMMFHSLEEIKDNEAHIQDYIKQAIQNHKAGKEIKITRSKKLTIPLELQKALDDDDQLNKAFSQFTTGKQREFSEYIQSAKQTATKERRIKKISKLILGGIGLNDKYK